MGAEALPAPTRMRRRKSRIWSSRPPTLSRPPSPEALSARRTAWPGSTAASAAASSASSLSRAGLTRGHVNCLAARQLGADMSVRGQEALKVALDHIGRDQAVAADAQPGRDARALADDGDARLKVARLGAIRACVFPIAEAHVCPDDHVLVKNGALHDAPRPDA